MPLRYLVLMSAIVLLMSPMSFGQAPKKLTQRETEFFESNIRPLLVKHCYECHSVEAGAAEGGLRVDSATALRKGGDTGPALVPGDPERSLLMLAVRHERPAKAMPPVDHAAKLSDSEIQNLAKWIRGGAPDPRPDNARAIERKESRDFYESLQTWWAYQPIKAPTPVVADADYSEQAIDQLVRAAQIRAGTVPVSDASYETLIRRAYYDLTGLPPTVEQAHEFKAAMKSKGEQQAYTELIDSLLASDQFGMHWGRHWLDVARYAESTGREVNVAYPHAWRYRNWVIDAVNADMPYDDFLIRQIAGDLLPTKSEAEMANNLIATGFLAVGSRALNERNPQQFAVDQADEQIDATFQATMGLTFACARCHDHKFDPVTQRDYTAVAGIFLSTKTLFGTAANGNQNRNGSSLKTLPAQTNQVKLQEDIDKSLVVKQREELSRLEADIVTLQRELFLARKNNADLDQSKVRELRRKQDEAGLLQSKLDGIDNSGRMLALAMTVEDQPVYSQTPRFVRAIRKNNGRTTFDAITNSPLYARGEIALAGEPVPRSVPEMFGKAKRYEIPENSSGRLQLARWITAPHNPLTARVAANRIWTWIFDEPIVESVDNFGTSGSEPSNPELLDYLATKFTASGWSQKALIREIMLSRTYRLSSSHHSANAEKDPDNKTFWRANLKRLPAEAIRDSMLLSAGQLDQKMQVGSEIAEGGDGIVRLLPEGVSKERLKNGPFAKAVRTAISPVGLTGRTVFLAFPRGEAYELFELFDAPDAAAVQGRRDTTNVPTQALYLLNNPAVQKYALQTAQAVIKQAGKGSEREAKIDLMFQTVLSRNASQEELANSVHLLQELRGDEAQAFASLAKSLFASAEFRYIE